MNYFNRTTIHSFPLTERANKVFIERSYIDPVTDTTPVPESLRDKAAVLARQLLAAREAGKSRMLVFGAHTIKNGLGVLLNEFIKKGWVSHLATNGAGVIHDWEFAFQGASSEDVRENVRTGKFGTWEETGLYINLALAVGAWQGLGYGESVGKMIVDQGIVIPSRDELGVCYKGTGLTEDGEKARKALERGDATVEARLPPLMLWKQSAALDLLELIEVLGVPSGFLSIPHSHARFSVQAAAFRAGMPFTSHPMFGHDIIYTHRASRGAVIGRCAERDFLAFAASVANLEGGVYLSVGSAVMSPMIFEKALSMARNSLRAADGDIQNCQICVVDLQEADWDWSRGEPPMDNPAYYLRFMKTFNRMGCPLSYISADNRLFLLALYRALRDADGHDGGAA